MKKQNRKTIEKEKVFGILSRRRRKNAVTLDELFGLTLISKKRLRQIIYELSVKDYFPIALKTEFPYGFYIRDEEL